MTLIPRNLTQDCGDPGKTFRGPHARVENGLNRDCNDSNTAFNRGGTAKPGPTTDTSSRIARLKRLQIRTRKLVMDFKVLVEPKEWSTCYSRKWFNGADPDHEEHNYLETMEKLFQVKLLVVVVIPVKLFISKMYLTEFHLINQLLFWCLETIKFSVVNLYND